MTHVGDYRKLVRKHADELIVWGAQNPDQVKSNVGNRTISEYLDEYSAKFAIAAYLAMDLDMPRAMEMLEEYKPFHDLEELMD